MTNRRALLAVSLSLAALSFIGCGGGGGGSAGPTHGVSYDGNGSTGGTVPADAAEYRQGQAVTVLGNPGALVKNEASFGGWCVNADGTGYTYLEGQTFLMGTEDEILYAKWIPDPTYTVTYRGNSNTGGAVPVDDNAYPQGATVTVLGNTGALVRAGNSFIGWCLSEDGSGTCYLPGATFAIAGANVILNARWTSNPTYTVTYHDTGSTGGSAPVDANNYEQGTTVMVLGNTGGMVTAATQDGLTLVFDGWNTQSDGLGTTIQPGEAFTMGAAGVDLYPRWTVIRATGPAGGYVFYDKGEVTDGWRYLEAAPSDQAVQRYWFPSQLIEAPTTGATATAIGTGAANTALIVGVQGAPGAGEDPYAAWLCDSLVIDSLDGWFLPSQDELNLMYARLHLAGIGGFDGESGYWSSSEWVDDPHFAWNQYFKTGGQGHDAKYWNNNVRAIRAF